MKKIALLPLAFALLVGCNSVVKDTTIAEVEVKNTSDFDRTVETIEIAWEDIQKENLIADSTVVIDKATSLEIPSQIIKCCKGDVMSLIFQTQLAQNSTATYILKEGTPKNYKQKTYGTVVGKRYDDFAWENDIIAYRVYNEKLIPVDGPSGGVDVWSKRTNELIVDKWYANGHYHNDHGEGCDHYKVGPSLGAGGLGFIVNDKLIQHSNYIDAKIIANGPIRFKAKLTFPELKIDNSTIGMTKVITLDAGQNLNKFKVDFSGNSEDIRLATGIILRKEAGEIVKDENNKYISYWQAKHKTFDHTGVGVISSNGSAIKEIDNHLVIESPFNDESFVYYSGACWSKAEASASPLLSPNTKEKWDNSIATYATQLDNPLEVNIIK